MSESAILQLREEASRRDPGLGQPEGRPTPAIFELDGVTKLWGADVVLDDVQFALERGTLTAITGQNGAGKTTLLRIAAGIILPDRGIVRHGGIDIERNGREYRRRLGFLSPGDQGLYARLTARQNLEFWAQLALLSRRRRKAIAQSAIDTFELQGFSDRRVDRLSMGQRQRVRLAMTFLHQPELVLLDEPRTSLDDPGVDLLDDALDALVERGGAAVWASPHREESRADRHYAIEAAKLRPVSS